MELSSDKNYDSNGQLKIIKNFSLFYQCRLTWYILNLKIYYINREKISIQNYKYAWKINYQIGHIIFLLCKK